MEEEEYELFDGDAPSEALESGSNSESDEEFEEYDPVNDRMGHVVAVWRDLTLVWGGFFDGQVSDDHETYDLTDMWDPSVVEVHQDGVWRSVKTRGQFPPETCNPAAEVIGDGLFVACGNVKGEGVTNELYRLDLITWKWSKLEPTGTRPLKSRNLASWVSGERMFLFGGVGEGKHPSLWYPQYLKIQDESFQDHVRSNQLVYYDSKDNSWNWPSPSGSIPSPRSEPAAFSVDGCYKDRDSDSERFRDLAFLFGGRDRRESFSELYILDISSMRWDVLSEDGVDPMHWPTSRAFHSLTRISSKAAVLVGGRHHSFYHGTFYIKSTARGLEDCWRLNIEACIAQDKEIIWTRCKHHEHICCTRQCQNRAISGWELHKAVQEPGSGRVWVIGGLRDNHREGEYRSLWWADHIRELGFDPPSLKVLAVESATKHFDSLAPEIRSLPEKNAMRLAIEDKSKRKYVIS